MFWWVGLDPLDSVLLYPTEYFPILKPLESGDRCFRTTWNSSFDDLELWNARSGGSTFGNAMAITNHPKLYIPGASPAWPFFTLLRASKIRWSIRAQYKKELTWCFFKEDATYSEFVTLAPSSRFLDSLLKLRGFRKLPFFYLHVHKRRKAAEEWHQKPQESTTRPTFSQF